MALILATRTTTIGTTTDSSRLSDVVKEQQTTTPIAGVALLAGTWTLSMGMSELFQKTIEGGPGFFGAVLGVSIANLLLAILLLFKKDKAIAFIFYFNALLQLLLIPQILNPGNWDSDIMWPNHLSLIPLKVAFGLLIPAQLVIFFKAWLWQYLTSDNEESKKEEKGPFEAADHLRF